MLWWLRLVCHSAVASSSIIIKTASKSIGQLEEGSSAVADALLTSRDLTRSHAKSRNIKDNKVTTAMKSRISCVM
jgi:hypothetical protein